jgi:hypothetical protein
MRKPKERHGCADGGSAWMFPEGAILILIDIFTGKQLNCFLGKI